jgi:hypothetical protein
MAEIGWTGSLGLLLRGPVVLKGRAPELSDLPPGRGPVPRRVFFCVPVVP